MLLSRCQARAPAVVRAATATGSTSSLPASTRSYAVSLKECKDNKNKVFKDKKAYQYSWYSRLLESSRSGPLIILHHDEFSAERLKKLRSDIAVAAKKVKVPEGVTPEQLLPTLTVVRSSIFGVALRRFPDTSVKDLEAVIQGGKGSFAVLSIPTMHPPLLSAVLRAMDRSVPPKPPKTPAELKAEEDAKSADPDQPGRRMKRVRPIRTPALKVMGAIIEGRVFVPQGLKEVSELPTLDTLRAQIVGLLSAPASQLAAVLAQASGGQLARTLEGFKKGLEEQEGGAPPSS